MGQSIIRKQNKLLKRIVFGILGGISSFAFAPTYCVLILFLTIGLLFLRLNRSESYKDSFGSGFWFGFGLGGVSTSWLFQALLIDDGAYAWLIPICFCGMGLLFGLFWGLAACGANYYFNGWKRALAFASLMTVLEWVRSWFLTGFPWNLMGSVWENQLPILQTASVVGVYGLTFLTIIVCVTPAFWPNKKPIMFAVLGLAVLYGLGAWRIYAQDETMATGMKIRLVQPNIPATLKWDEADAENQVRKLIHLSRENNDEITHVLWPEAALPFAIDTHSDKLAPLLQAVRQGGYLITGVLRKTSDKNEPIANSLVVFNDLAEAQGYYDKAHLVPFGEYMPLNEYIPIGQIIGGPMDLKAGTGIQTMQVVGTPSFGALVCYEVIFSGQVVDKKHRPFWLVNLTNDSWYGDSAGPYQHLGMAKMRAVEEGLPLVRVANTGVSAVFNPYGEIMGLLPLNTEGVLDSKLPMPLPPTIYSQLGAGLPVGISLAILFFLGVRRKKS